MLELSRVSSALVHREQPEKVAGGSWIGGAADSTDSEALPVCPCCRQGWRAGSRFSVDINTNTLIVDGEAIQLRPLQADLAQVLHKKAPGHASHTEIERALWGMATEGPRDIYGNIKVQVCYLRKALKNTAFEIHAISARRLGDRGYQLRLRTHA